MLKTLQKILLLTAVCIAVGHSVFPHIHHTEEKIAAHKHHHHDESAPASHHQHEEEESNADKQHGILSFAALDDNYVPGKTFTKKIEPPAQFLSLISTIVSGYNLLAVKKTEYGEYKEFPPPENVYANLPSRAPPQVFFS